MKQRFAVFLLLTMLLAAGCSQNGVNDEEMQQTQTQVANEIISTQTQAALDTFLTQTASVPTITSTPTNTATPVFTPTQTHTPTATNTPTPTLIPAVVSIWDNLIVEDVCFNISQSFPQFEDSFELPVFDMLAELLSSMELNAIEGNEGCDITITIGFEGDVYSSKYNSTSGEKMTCFSGARIDGYMRAENPDHPSIDIPLRDTYSPQLLTGTCDSEPTSHVAWSAAYSPAIIQGLAEIWGPPIAVAAIKSTGVQTRKAGLGLIKQYGPEASEAAPLLIAMLEEKKGGIAYTEVAEALGMIGPAAMEGVPVLIELFAKEAVNMYGMPYLYRSALKRITGQDFDSDDPGVWETWWELFNNPDIDLLTKTLLTASAEEERKAAAELLASLGSKAIDAIPTLILALEDSSEDVRKAARTALGQFGPEAVEAVPALVNSMRITEDSFERRSIAHVLESIGLEAIPELILLGGENTHNCMAYTNQSKSALVGLKWITGLEYDLSKWGVDWEGVCADIIDYLEDCQTYYDANKEN